MPAIIWDGFGAFLSADFLHDFGDFPGLLGGCSGDVSGMIRGRFGVASGSAAVRIRTSEPPRRFGGSDRLGKRLAAIHRRPCFASERLNSIGRFRRLCQLATSVATRPDRKQGAAVSGSVIRFLLFCFNHSGRGIVSFEKSTRGFQGTDKSECVETLFGDMLFFGQA